MTPRQLRSIRGRTRTNGACPACRVHSDGPGLGRYRKVVCVSCGAVFYLGRLVGAKT